MEDIVKKFLIEKLIYEIKEAEGDAKSLRERNVRCKSFEGEWEKVKVKDNIGREQLYKCLNLTAEWRQLAKQASCCDPKTLKHPFHDELAGIINQVKINLQDSAHTEEQQQQQQPPTATPQIYRWTSHKNPPQVKVHGFDDKLKVMKRLLLKKETMAIGISGVAGVGKTVLAREAYNHAEVKEQFLLRMWLCMSKQQEIVPEEPAKRMLRCLGFEGHVIDRLGPAKLLPALRQQLIRGRFLIVLDDVWADEETDKDEYKNLISFLTAECGGERKLQGKVIVTSRSPELENVVGVGPNNITQRLLPLEDSDSCWEIFTDALGGKVISESEEMTALKVLKAKIVEKCEGLPLMAKMLGKYGTA